MASFINKSSVLTAVAVLLVALLVSGAVVACVIFGDGRDPGSTTSVPETETKSDGGEETTSSGTDTPTSGGEEQTGSGGGEETHSDGNEPTESSGHEEQPPEENPQEEIEYVEGDPSYFWRIVPKTVIDPEHPLRLLVNSTHAIPDGYVDSITLKSAGGYKMDSRAASALNKLIAAAEKDGIKIKLCSGFRTNERQIELYTKRIATEQKNDKTLTWKEACLKAARTNALPGTSEHETGLCWDFSDLNYSFDTTKEYAWLKAHAEEYGFVMRYPKDKQDITGIIYEPWHWRYVGVEDAKEMNRLGLCLEEYVEYLAKQ